MALFAEIYHTNLVEHLVTLIEDKDLDATKAEVLVTDQGIQTARGGDDYVRVSVFVLEDLGVLNDRGSTVEDGGLDLWHILAESGVFVLDLVGQLAGVAHNED